MASALSAPMVIHADLQHEKDEAVLAASFRQPEAFRVLVQRYEEAFLRKARTVVHRYQDAEEVVQETFVKIYKNGHTFKKRPGIEFKSWAYKILMNTAITRYTKLRRESGNLPYEDFLDAGDDASDIPDGEDMVTQTETKESVQVVLAKMPMPLADAMRAYYFDGKSYQEIAREFNISLSSLKMRLFRARRLFKKIFEEA